MGNGKSGSQGFPAWLEEAVGLANIPTLICLLVQLSGDRRWIEGRYIPSLPDASRRQNFAQQSAARS